MNQDNEDSIIKLISQLKKEYNNIKEIIIENKTLIIHADDDTLWKIFEDKRYSFNIEFEAGSGEKCFIRIIS